MKFRSFLPALFFAAAASAATITIESATAAWQNKMPNDPGIVINNAASPIRIQWGVPLPGSAYEFELSVPPLVQASNPPPVTPWFEVGMFNHQNFVIDPPILDSVELMITLGIDIDGTDFVRDFTFLVTHIETPNISNNPGACQFPGQGNANGCDDLVVITTKGFPTTFTVGLVEYTLEVAFFDPIPTTQVNQFFTKENQENFVQLGGRFTSQIVPEPSTYGMMAVGVISLILGARRRFKQ